MSTQVTNSEVFSFTDNSYFDQAFGSAELLISNAERTLKGLDIEFDSMVAIGHSGLLVLPLLARHFDVPFLALRKRGTYTHDSIGIGKYGRGSIGKRWILVDDFVSSGSTTKTAQSIVTEAIGYQANDFETEYLGCYCYCSMLGSIDDGGFVYPDLTKKTITEIEIDGKPQYVDGRAYGIVRRRIWENIQHYRLTDPKGDCISWYQENYSHYRVTIDMLAAMAVYAERYITEHSEEMKKYYRW